MDDTAAREVKEIVVEWARAIAEGDRERILAKHSDDLLMFDFPSTVEGLGDYNTTWDFFYGSPRGPIVFEPRNIRAIAGEDVAFVTCEIRCDGTSAGPLELRLTTGLERRDGDWVITHEHHSVPTVEERLIGPAS